MSSFKFDKSQFKTISKQLAKDLREAGEEAMAALMQQAEQDAREMADWHPIGTYEETYGDVVWNWTTTGLAAQSIQAYVVPNKKLDQASYENYSFKNGMPLKHIAKTDDRVTGNHRPEDGKIIGIITMNAAYASYLQDWEAEEGDQPVAVRVLQVNWTSYYVPLLQSLMQTAMTRRGYR